MCLATLPRMKLGGRCLRLCELAVELLAKLPRLCSGDRGLKAAQKMVEIDVRHTSILHCRLVMSVILAVSPAPVFLARSANTGCRFFGLLSPTEVESTYPA